MLLFWLHIDLQVMISFSYLMDKPRSVFNYSRSKYIISMFSKLKMAKMTIDNFKKTQQMDIFLFKFAFYIFCSISSFALLEKTLFLSLLDTVQLQAEGRLDQ